MRKIPHSVVIVSVFLLFITLFTCNAYADQGDSIKAEIQSAPHPLFEKAAGEFYNYAPCYVQVNDTTKYVFYCSNQTSSEIVDYICWRKADLTNGIWVWGNENVAFGPSTGEWDQCHVCDPDVIQGQFNYNDHTYSWAMTYLGVAQWDCNANQIGIAFADSIEGPWVKYESNPIINAPNTYSWGAGQDSMVSLNNAGLVRIIYRYSDGTDDYCKYKDFDFSNVNSYTESVAHPVTRNGLTDGLFHTCASHVAYDPSRELYFMAAEHIWDESKRSCRETMIATLSKSDFESGTGEWNIIYQYNQGVTGYASNHNAAIGRDSCGRIFDYNTLTVVLSSSDDSGLWSFKINESLLGLSNVDNSVCLENGHAYKLVNKESGLVLDNWNTANGDACYQYSWTGVHNQQWIATSSGGNNYKLVNRWSKKALDNYENSTPSIVYIWDDVYAKDQHWEITRVSGNYVKVKNIMTGRCLTSYGNDDASPVEALSYTGDNAQLWELVDLGEVESPVTTVESGNRYKLINKLTGDVLDNWNATDGANCYSYTWTGVQNQQWIITSIGNSAYKIVNGWTNKALDCYGMAKGSPVYTWSYVDGIDQYWTITSCGSGLFYITNQKNGMVLTQSIQGNGNAIFCSSYVGNPAQQWVLVKTN